MKCKTCEGTGRMSHVHGEGTNLTFLTCPACGGTGEQEYPHDEPRCPTCGEGAWPSWPELARGASWVHCPVCGTHHGEAP